MNNSGNNSLKYNQITLSKKKTKKIIIKDVFFSLLRNIEIDGALLIDIGSLFHDDAAEILKDLLVIYNRHRASSS